jgi:hypothetical protein
VHLVGCCSGVRDAAEGQRADDGIEPAVSEGEVLGVALDEGDINAKLGCWDGRSTWPAMQRWLRRADEVSRSS